MFWKKRSNEEVEADERAERAVRRILNAAAATGEPAPPSPFLMSRLRARIASESARKGRAPAAELALGAAARSMAPAFAILLTVLSAVTAYQQVESARAEKEAIARLMEPQSGGDDLMLAALFLSGDPGSAVSGAMR